MKLAVPITTTKLPVLFPILFLLTFQHLIPPGSSVLGEDEEELITWLFDLRERNHDQHQATLALIDTYADRVTEGMVGNKERATLFLDVLFGTFLPQFSAIFDARVEGDAGMNEPLCVLLFDQGLLQPAGVAPEKAIGTHYFELQNAFWAYQLRARGGTVARPETPPLPPPGPETAVAVPAPFAHFLKDHPLLRPKTVITLGQLKAMVLDYLEIYPLAGPNRVLYGFGRPPRKGRLREARMMAAFYLLVGEPFLQLLNGEAPFPPPAPGGAQGQQQQQQQQQMQQQQQQQQEQQHQQPLGSPAPNAENEENQIMMGRDDPMWSSAAVGSSPGQSSPTNSLRSLEELTEMQEEEWPYPGSPGRRQQDEQWDDDFGPNADFQMQEWDDQFNLDNIRNGTSPRGHEDL